MDGWVGVSGGGSGRNRPGGGESRVVDYVLDLEGVDWKGGRRGCGLSWGPGHGCCPWGRYAWYAAKYAGMPAECGVPRAWECLGGKEWLERPLGI